MQRTTQVFAGGKALSQAANQSVDLICTIRAALGFIQSLRRRSVGSVGSQLELKTNATSAQMKSAPPTSTEAARAILPKEVTRTNATGAAAFCADLASSEEEPALAQTMAIHAQLVQTSNAALMSTGQGLAAAGPIQVIQATSVTHAVTSAVPRGRTDAANAVASRMDTHAPLAQIWIALQTAIAQALAEAPRTITSATRARICSAAQTSISRACVPAPLMGCSATLVQTVNAQQASLGKGVVQEGLMVSLAKHAQICSVAQTSISQVHAMAQKMG